MPAGNSYAHTLTLPSDLEIEMVRTFDAPLRLVWACHTEPAHLKNWWGRRGSTLVVCEVDLRVGGRWRFVSRDADGKDYGFRGEFREIVPCERVVQTFEFEGLPGHIAVDTLTLAERDGRTTITVRSRFDSRADRDGMIASGMEVGAAETWDRLADLLRSLI